MIEILKAMIYAVLLLSPCIVAARCATERRMKRLRREEPYPGLERRDLR
jgi:hypothetical protein